MAKVREKTETSAEKKKQGQHHSNAYRTRNQHAEGTRKCTEPMGIQTQGRTTLQVNTAGIFMPISFVSFPYTF